MPANHRPLSWSYRTQGSEVNSLGLTRKKEFNWNAGPATPPVHIRPTTFTIWTTCVASAPTPMSGGVRPLVLSLSFSALGSTVPFATVTSGLACAAGGRKVLPDAPVPGRLRRGMVRGDPWEAPGCTLGRDRTFTTPATFVVPAC